MNERRIARLQEQIKHHLATVLMRDLADPKLGMVTITRVELDREFTMCKAYWSVLGDEAQQSKSAAALRRARGLCQRAIGDALHTRTVPHLEFVFDAGIAEAIRLNNLMADLRREREAREAERPPEDPPAPGDVRGPGDGSD
ncbi:MAG: 30S ribosome-binding factor RbfA [Planctomycetes bacterium]|nr:30S ribosome-binding factor RbfA [Planctomycetota bacterium]